MDDRQDKILTAGTYELADDYHARILAKVCIDNPTHKRFTFIFHLLNTFDLPLTYMQHSVLEVGYMY